MSVFVIAEVGPNHNGSLETALELVRRLGDSGANAIKFQLARPEAVYSADAFKAGYQARNDGDGAVIEMSRRLQLPQEAHLILAEACKVVGIPYMCTAFDMGSLRFLDQHFDMPAFKVASGEMMTIDMLEYMSERRRPVIMSTGMAAYNEIRSALLVLQANGLKDITLLHCVSNYPAPHVDINLRVMTELATRFHCKVGFSDHSIGPECCLAAVAMGAVVIEKHVTLDTELPGPDHKASATIEEFTALVSSIRLVEAALGVEDKCFSSEEEGIRKMARKSIVTTRALPVGSVIQWSDIAFKRPGTGISPMDRDRVLGRRTLRNLDADRVIYPEDIELD